MAAFESVLRDLRKTCAVLPIIERAGAHAGAGDPGPGLWLKDSDGTGQMIMVGLGLSRAEQLARLADQTQEWAVEALWAAGLSTNWPECPAHPRTHPLSADLDGNLAVWCCPGSGRTMALIGQLPSPGRNP